MVNLQAILRPVGPRSPLPSAIDVGKPKLSVLGQHRAHDEARVSIHPSLGIPCSADAIEAKKAAAYSQGWR